MCKFLKGLKEKNHNFDTLPPSIDKLEITKLKQRMKECKGPSCKTDVGYKDVLVNVGVFILLP